MTTGSAGILFPSPELIRKGLTGGVFIAPYTAAAISASNLFDPTSGALVNPLPSGYRDLGFLSTAGAVFARSAKTTDIDSWQSDTPTRTDVTSDTSTLTIVPQETNQSTLSAYLGIQAGSVLTPAANGTFSYQRPAVPTPTYWRVLALGVDETTYGEVVVARFFPRALVTAYASQAFANASDPIEWGVTITAYLDSVLGTPEIYLFGGEGQPALQSDMGWNRTVTCTVATTTTLTATTGSFYPNDVGSVVAGTGITAGTTVASYTDSTHVTMSAVGTTAGSAVAVTIDAQA
jgi:hypothetical protein